MLLRTAHDIDKNLRFVCSEQEQVLFSKIKVLFCSPFMISSKYCYIQTEDYFSSLPVNCAFLFVCLVVIVRTGYGPLKNLQFVCLDKH